MQISKTKMDKVMMIKPDVFEDHRGDYVEIYNEQFFKENKIDIKFIQDDISFSTQNVLRGIHGDEVTWKLVSCLYGKFYLVVVNCDTSSSGFGTWQSFVLSDRNRHQVLIPPKFGNGHLVLSDSAIFHYKQSTYYSPEKQFTYVWNEPRFGIWWPTREPILSRRDELGRRLD